MGVYEPREDSYLLQKYVKEYAFGKVLEIGTGSGILAVEASQSHKVTSVLAVDIQKEVIAHCKKTIKDKEAFKIFANAQCSSFKIPDLFSKGATFPKGPTPRDAPKKRINRILTDAATHIFNASIKKIRFIQSNLFANVKGTFDTIIFNPPYLPADKRDPDITLDGGKHGYETIELFLNAANNYLTENGKILLLFSSLTHKEKVDAFIIKNLFTAKQIGEQHISFETLYVYSIEKSSVLREIEHKKITNLTYFAKGKRGLAYKGTYKGKTVIIKIPNPESYATTTIDFEEKWLKKMNALKIGPQFYCAGKDFLAMEFIDGLEIMDYLQNSTKQNIKKVIQQLLKQMRVLDTKGILKQEMTHPHKHIIVRKNKPYLIDFERCRYTERSRNVNQFLQFLTSYRVAELLTKKKIMLEKNKIDERGREYSKTKKLPHIFS